VRVSCPFTIREKQEKQKQKTGKKNNKEQKIIKQTT